MSTQTSGQGTVTYADVCHEAVEVRLTGVPASRGRRRARCRYILSLLHRRLPLINEPIFLNKQARRIGAECEETREVTGEER